jgi:hypothetical protein
MPLVEQGAKAVTDLALKSWLNAGPVDRSVGNGLMFVASDASARTGRASWILTYRFGGRKKEVQVVPLPAADPVGRFAQQARRAPHLVLLRQAGIGDGCDLDGGGSGCKEQLGIGVRQAPEREPRWLDFHIAELEQAPEQPQFHLGGQRLLHALVPEALQQILALRRIQARSKIVQHGLQAAAREDGHVESWRDVRAWPNVSETRPATACSFYSSNIII